MNRSPIETRERARSLRFWVGDEQQARQLGASVLNGNVRDFDFLTQIMPTGRIILYRATLGPRSS